MILKELHIPKQLATVDLFEIRQEPCLEFLLNFTAQRNRKGCCSTATLCFFSGKRDCGKKCALPTGSAPLHACFH